MTELATKPTPKLYTIDDVEDTLAGHCDRRGVDLVTVTARLRKDPTLSVKHALKPPGNNLSRGKMYRILLDGEERKGTIFTLCRKTGVKHQTVRRRLERGWTAQRAFTTPVKGKT